MVKARYDLGNKTLHRPYTFFYLWWTPLTTSILYVRTMILASPKVAVRCIRTWKHACMHALSLSYTYVLMWKCLVTTHNISVTKTLTHYYLPALRFNILFKSEIINLKRCRLLFMFKIYFVEVIDLNFINFRITKSLYGH